MTRCINMPMAEFSFFSISFLTTENSVFRSSPEILELTMRSASMDKAHVSVAGLAAKVS